jgi:hypothetical protein
MEAKLRSNGPIRFYGKIVDQNSNAIAGVRVRLRYREYRIVAPTVAAEDNHRVDLTTDEKGRFELANVSGETMWIEEIVKPGYQLSARVNLIPKTDVSPDAPVIFRMWKFTGSAEPLVSMSFRRTGIPVDGTPTTFDLFQSKKNSGAQDVKVTLSRIPLHIKRGTNRFDWEATIEIPNGGLLPSDDEFMNEAPAEGYQPALRVEMNANDPNWLPYLRTNFFIKVRGQCFGKMNIDLSADYEPPPTGLSIGTAVNPTGSRNLESK